MSQTKITELTPEQEALIPVYREKWRAIALSTEPIDRQKATEAIKAVWGWIYYSEPPEILFFDSPFAALNYIAKELLFNPDSELTKQLRENIDMDIETSERPDSLMDNVMQCNLKELYNELDENLYLDLWWEELGNYLDAQITERVYIFIEQLLTSKLGEDISKLLIKYLCNGLKNRRFGGVIPEKLAGDASLFEFGIYELNCCESLQESWLQFQLIIKNCGWIFPFHGICLVCDRPRIISFDNQQELHAEGAPAIQFADGYSLYAYHGVTLPEEYGTLHPNQWKAEWILEEKNAELRRVLIQGIGYARICQELEATELDTWQEYTLLKIDKQVDDELLYLLKMTCPSTGHIHALRVPPEIRSARESIRWVNWGIDPEEFSVQT